MKDTWMDAALETMTEDELHQLLVAEENAVAADPDEAISRAYNDLTDHFGEHVAIVVWGEAGTQVIGNSPDEISAIMERLRRAGGGVCQMSRDGRRLDS